ncbi:hypothetical protein J437_LFUL007685 [Ladona fulva]|uniref:Uncharacterized protein n=1 Tax=Ladona fulva TaxID=123851 RepID=A0A8K0NYP3_LADFU|nr:hypothetical protein J437_LFUL007685 [Ladona fulva]
MCTGKQRSNSKKTLIRTVLSYGSETWTMTATSAELLDNLERRMLRRIYGPVNSEGIWRICWNHEIYELYKEPKISTHIKLMRLRWAGHVQRMPETRAAKKVFLESMGGKRAVGKPRARWEDNMTKSDSPQQIQGPWSRTLEDTS